MPGRREGCEDGEFGVRNKRREVPWVLGRIEGIVKPLADGNASVCLLVTVRRPDGHWRYIRSGVDLLDC